MPYDFSQFENKINEIEEWLSREFSMIRTGRATSAILDGVKTVSYGAKIPINQVAGVTIEDARTLRVTPWDKNTVKEIERAIQEADIGLSVVVDEQGLRVVFPELTEERRGALTKLMKAKLEEARVSLRRARDEAWNDIQENEKRGAFGEDDRFRLKEEMEKMASEAHKKLDGAAEKKEKEISS